MVLQSTPTYRVALEWMQGFCDALQSGEVPTFVAQSTARDNFPGLSHVSSVGSAHLSQLTFVDSSQTQFTVEPEMTSISHVSDEMEEKEAAPIQSNEREATSTSADTGTVPNVPREAPETPLLGAKETPIMFASPPRIPGMSRRQKRRAAGGKELKDARALKIRDGKKVRKAINTIKAASNCNLLAHWSDYGSVTLDQLQAMADIIEARNQFRLVEFTMAWMDRMEWHISDLTDPFKDTCNVTKLAYKEAVQTMNLGTVRIGGVFMAGHVLLDFREALWLHTTFVIAGMMALKDTYPNVGVINPSYHDLAGISQKKRTAGGFGGLGHAE
ncbi:unnamed protein product [Phytophthora fragariaefolia]|uniref:Unnamed protein product n=1 Tax=Phytophthora fragariaefolia TaxID=1490495 RepID=A0A9W6XPG3_9STRA|nr:unnamed protein product [Phytophthora fragariaefolia]